jgi:hypothetical protein
MQQKNKAEEEFPHILRWDRLGRKGQRCKIIRTHNATCQVEFPDGFVAALSRRALVRAG